MEIDLAQLDSAFSTIPDLLRAEVCIIGGGIAGLTLAHKLSQLGRDVLLLESGGNTRKNFAPIQQAGDLHRGTSEPRPRALGGTSLTWGGQLLPLPFDNNWPIPADELARKAREAERLFGVDDLPYDGPAFFDRTHQPAPGFLSRLPQLIPTISKFAPFSHRNLARTLGSALRSHSRARIAVHAHATELILTSGRDHINAVLIRTPSGRTHRIEATQFVLAAGTVETVLLLLASRSVATQGVGNEHDQVGRNFHDHLTVTAAVLREPARTQLITALRPWIHHGTLHSLKLAASAELESQLNLTPIIAHLTIHEPDDSGIGALRTLLRARQQNHLAHSLLNNFAELPRALAVAARLTLAARTQHRRYVSPRATVELRLNAAQHTPSASRITLSPELAPIMDWRIQPAELATLRLFTQHLRTHLQSAGLDSLDWNPSLFEPVLEAPIPNLDDARHAMGGACMGLDPRTSVVDTNLRVHGVRNLFIASTAVFPDGSPQLPTLPLLALTLRLAEHLNHLR